MWIATKRITAEYFCKKNFIPEQWCAARGNGNDWSIFMMFLIKWWWWWWYQWWHYWSLLQGGCLRYLTADCETRWPASRGEKHLEFWKTHFYLKLFKSRGIWTAFWFQLWYLTSCGGLKGCDFNWRGREVTKNMPSSSGPGFSVGTAAIFIFNLVVGTGALALPNAFQQASRHHHAPPI